MCCFKTATCIPPATTPTANWGGLRRAVRLRGKFRFPARPKKSSLWITTPCASNGDLYTAGAGTFKLRDFDNGISAITNLGKVPIEPLADMEIIGNEKSHLRLVASSQTNYLAGRRDTEINAEAFPPLGDDTPGVFRIVGIEGVVSEIVLHSSKTVTEFTSGSVVNNQLTQARTTSIRLQGVCAIVTGTGSGSRLFTLGDNTTGCLGRSTGTTYENTFGEAGTGVHHIQIGYNANAKPMQHTVQYGQQDFGYQNQPDQQFYMSEGCFLIGHGSTGIFVTGSIHGFGFDVPENKTNTDAALSYIPLASPAKKILLARSAAFSVSFIAVLCENGTIHNTAAADGSYGRTYRYVAQSQTWVNTMLGQIQCWNYRYNGSPLLYSKGALCRNSDHRFSPVALLTDAKDIIAFDGPTVLIVRNDGSVWTAGASETGMLCRDGSSGTESLTNLAQVTRIGEIVREEDGFLIDVNDNAYSVGTSYENGQFCRDNVDALTGSNTNIGII